MKVKSIELLKGCLIRVYWRQLEHSIPTWDIPSPIVTYLPHITVDPYVPFSLRDYMVKVNQVSPLSLTLLRPLHPCLKRR